MTSRAPSIPGAAGSPAQTPSLRLGNYEPLLELASGGMATVYAARQLGAAGFERLVVVKRVHRHLLGNRDFFNMFRDEARIAALIHHPNVVAVSDVVEAEGELLLVMEYVEGSSLSTLRGAAREANLKFPIPDAARIAVDALAGLQAAHDAVDMRGIKLDLVHRDVSPQNILVGVDGSSRVIDFGIAKARHRLTETKSGSLKGKYSYMAPEQTRGMQVDRRTDIFAWGVVLHEMLTGDRLFRGENEFDTMRRIWEMPIPNTSQVNPAVPPALDAVIQRALARNVDERFASANEVLDALEKAAPIGSPRDVAAFVERATGERLRERKRALHGMLEGRVLPLALDLPLDKDDSQTTLSPHSQPNSQIPRPPMSERSGEGSIALAQKTLVEVPHPHNRTGPAVAILAAITTVAVIAAAVAIGLFASRHGSVAAAGSSPSTSSASAAGSPTDEGAAIEFSSNPTAPATGDVPTSTVTPLAPGEVSFMLHADTTIVDVRLRGMHRLVISGNSAQIVAAQWSGKLRVDATLQGGKNATANVPSGAATAELVTPRTTIIAPPPTTRDPNLQANPY
ncbi:MAG: serine/threonine-protein kinase [Polyangiaceae bacterium]